MVRGDLAGELLLHFERGFDHGGDQARGHVPFDVAMEEPHAWVVGTEAEHDIAVRVDEDGVAAHGVGGEWRGSRGVVDACFVFAAVDDLKGVTVEVERVFSRVIVVQDDFDDLVGFEDKLVGVGAVDGGIGCVGASGEDGVEGGNFRCNVGHVVEESTAHILDKTGTNTRQSFQERTSLHRHPGCPFSGQAGSGGQHDRTTPPCPQE